MTDIKKLEFQVVELPTFEEKITTKDWVLWGGDNLWPLHTIELYNYSSINRACLNAKRDAVLFELYSLMAELSPPPPNAPIS